MHINNLSKNKNMKNNYRLFLFKMYSVSIFAFLVISGSNCENTTDSNVIPQEILGNWKLIEQTGALQDICPNETVVFDASGVATLTCPNSNSITRNYGVSNSVLTYTQSGVAYGLQIQQNGNLYLTGQNVSRNLLYQKVTDSVVNTDLNNKAESVNSSEEGK